MESKILRFIHYSHEVDLTFEKLDFQRVGSWGGGRGLYVSPPEIRGEWTTRDFRYEVFVDRANTDSKREDFISLVRKEWKYNEPYPGDAIDRVCLKYNIQIVTMNEFTTIIKDSNCVLYFKRI